MSLTQWSVVVAGVWLILEGVEAGLTNTATLIFGIAVVALVLLDSAYVRTYRNTGA